ncbi:glutamate--tRNA ligase [Prolixibacter sp. NT017]|nr:glutamate--tRNA ligase [Prolixibacter sp. NT017]
MTERETEKYTIMSERKVRVRFAPSPTGPLHMGGVRTALFNYLFAKGHGGDFLLRIEDTDQNRYVPGAEEYIMESLAWCGMQIDEGPKEGGPHGPYRQSERKELYHQYAEQLVASANAYYAFDTPEELEAARSDAEAKGETFTYNAATRGNMKNSLSLPEDEWKKMLADGVPAVVRFRMPDNESVTEDDLIRGRVTFETSLLDDKVLYKADGMPTYHLANVVDDHLMEITHVIRGEEWLSSMPLHVLLYRALGWSDTMPRFAHLPLILKPVGKGKLSKRDGDKMGFPVFPLEWKDPKSNEISRGYREDGYFPEAFINVLALLGWNPGTEQELFSMDELVNAFSLERVGKSGSRFDPEKTKWFNHQYLIGKSDDELAELFLPLLQEKGIDTGSEMVARICGMVKERCNFVPEIWEQSHFFFEAPTEYDAKVVKKRWKEGTPAMMTEIADFLETVENWKAPEIKEPFSAFVNGKEWGFGAVMNAFRLCLVGGGFGPDLFEICEIIGKEETIRRIRDGVASISR